MTHSQHFQSRVSVLAVAMPEYLTGIGYPWQLKWSICGDNGLLFCLVELLYFFPFQFQQEYIDLKKKHFRITEEQLKNKLLVSVKIEGNKKKTSFPCIFDPCNNPSWTKTNEIKSFYLVYKCALFLFVSKYSPWTFWQVWESGRAQQDFYLYMAGICRSLWFLIVSKSILRKLSQRLRA